MFSKHNRVWFVPALAVVALGCAPTVLRASSPAPAGRIAFSLGAHPEEDIYTVDVDGSGLQRLTTSAAADFDPSWSPDGSLIAFRHQVGDDETSEVYVMNADGSEQRNLSRHPGQDHAPAWSPDGKKIAFASARGRRGSLRIWVMNADGSHQKPLNPIDGEYPAWSPDGKKIAFERNTFGPTGWDLWVMDADGSHARPLVATRADEQGVAWSPDGGTIAFGSSRGAPERFTRIWVARADGTRQRLLANRPGERPVWSRDGRYLLFTAGGLFIVRRDGSGAVGVPTGAAGEAALADWSR
jgi:TolB protein